ncbi:MAG: hypothetical protein AABZ64_09330 [Nitrospinota bacterium]
MAAGALEFGDFAPSRGFPLPRRWTIRPESSLLPRRPRLALVSLGCKLNQAEGDAIRHGCAGAGYELVSFEEEAEAYVVNTCTVTSRADREGRRKWAAFAAGRMGERAEVLIERGRREGGLLSGLTDNYLRVIMEGPGAWRGRLLPVRLGPLPRGREARGRAARADFLWGEAP